MANVINVDNSTENSDWLISVRQQNEAADLQKMYISIGEEPPEGRQLFKGPRGGTYYLLDDQQTTTQYLAVDKRMKNDKRDEMLKEWGPLFDNAVKGIPKWLSDNLVVTVSVDMYHKAKEEGKELMRFGTYDGKTDEIEINPILSVLDNYELKRFMKAEYNDELTGSVFSVILGHEIGHRAMTKLYENDGANGTKLIPDLFKQYLKTPGAVTKYGKESARERFAEAFLYFIQNPRILRGRDPLSYHFIKDNIFGGKEFTEPLLKSLDKEEELPNGSKWIEDEKTVLRIIEKISQNQKAKKAEAVQEKPLEAPFIPWEPDRGLVQKGHKLIPAVKTTAADQQEFQLENPDYGFGGPMEPISKIRKDIKRIVDEDKSGK